MVEIVNKNFEKTSNTIKSPDEPVDAHKNMEKLLEVKNPAYYGLCTSKARYLNNSNPIKIL